MRSILLTAIALFALLSTNLVQAQNVIPLSDPVVTSMLNDPSSTQALADLGVIYPDASGIVVDCAAGQALLAFVNQLTDGALADIQAAEDAYNEARERGASEDELQALLAAWDEALANAQALLDLLQDPINLLEDILDAAGC